MAKEPKAPKIPRCLCNSWLHWVLQIGSPSKYYMAILHPTVESEKYFRDRAAYDLAIIRSKIIRRTCTREEWHRYRRVKARETRGQK